MKTRDHGGNLDAAIAQYGGTRSDWIDLSTGINPVPYPVGDISAHSWGTLPDKSAMTALISAARKFWNVPDRAAILPANGASALIRRMPEIAGSAYIPTPTYNEHAAAFGSADTSNPMAPVHIYVHPNNPDGRLWPSDAIGGRPMTVIDESFCDVTPDLSHMNRAGEDGIVILKSFGKFWGLAGLRLGFMIGTPILIARMAELLEPWSVNGPALEIGTRALNDPEWAEQTRHRLSEHAAYMDQIFTAKGATIAGGTSLFRLYRVDSAAQWQDRLARGHVWTRIFPYADDWIRVGLPAPHQWDQLKAAV